MSKKPKPLSTYSTRAIIREMERRRSEAKPLPTLVKTSPSSGAQARRGAAK